ncbi:class I SAM-dependent methyltransferase [Streptomyces spirodelae]|uniref:Methyltransferase domain-containing protein n=1 Tax=Streptomyces spirodelae TaxID=2812904 RepID=A0ABS3X2J3_9ACTN|nr:methyltransferase domain-containing protein [Streptomyces spirodelae]MBO8189602.1 methyltransferase domain-containing protein [Streptomyces spirodelae]
MTHDLAADRAAVRAFFGERAARWDTRFPDDGPAFAAAVDDIGLRPGDAVLDAGCGTGRALPALRAVVGPGGTVLGADLTPAMLEEVARAGRRDAADALFLADVSQLPLRDGCLDAVFGAGLISHLPGPESGLRELARVVRPQGSLALFHPVGRAALAARQGKQITSDDIRAEPRLRALLATTGWRLLSYVDEDERYLALAEREAR